jgi:hypothetical protein
MASLSMPAVDPHSLPAGRSPQFLVTIGAGFGIPSPEMGLPVAMGIDSVDVVEVVEVVVSASPHPASRIGTQANSV